MKANQFTLQNVVNIMDSVYYQIYEEDYIKEQAAYRINKCLEANSKCVREIENPEEPTEPRYKFTNCEYCGCSAPHLFYAPNKYCLNKDNSVKWGHMMSKENWEEFKKDNSLIELLGEVESSIEPTINNDTNDKLSISIEHTNGESQPSDNI